MKVLVTGSAGFIGSALVIKLLERGDRVIGIDNHNGYYDPLLKDARLKRHINHPNYTHYIKSIEDRDEMEKFFKKEEFQNVVNLAAQAGVRYSIENPMSYIDSNIQGFSNILEGCRHKSIQHLVYASSSSVYGLNKEQPYSTHHGVNHPVSLYAATKKSNELMAHAYSHLYNLPTTGLRFFTVYGPYDRPDMALQTFAKSIMEGKSINLYNYGKHKRDFTYIDDIVDGIIKVLDNPAKPMKSWDAHNPDPATSSSPYRVYNIGNNNPVDLLDFIDCLEKSLGKTVNKELLPMQPGDVKDTYANVDDLVKDFDYKPKINIEEGIEIFCEWYKKFYNY